MDVLLPLAAVLHVEPTTAPAELLMIFDRDGHRAHVHDGTTDSD